MQEEIDREASAPLFPWWFWFLGLGICLVWYFGPEIVEWRGGKSEPANSGEFGDLYGVINALFSGLAFLGVLVGIFIQGREFRLQLKEMSVSTREMTEQSKTYKEQLASLQFQNNLLKRQLIESQIQGRMEVLPFLVTRLSVHPEQVNFVMRNSGSGVFGIKCVSNLPNSSTHTHASLPESQTEIVCAFQCRESGLPHRVIINVSYTTRLGHSQLEQFTFEKPFKENVCAFSDVATLGKAIRQEVEGLL